MLRIIIVLLCFNFSLSSAQNKFELSEEFKMLLFTSVEYDGNGGSRLNFHRWLHIRENHYEYLDVKYSPTGVFYLPKLPDSISSEYQLKLYKIVDANSKNQSRYVLWYKDFSNEVCLRVGGYVENDIHLLFEYLKKYNIKKKLLKSMFEEWRLVNPLFAEVDWLCLLDGYYKNSTSSNCYLSAYYLSRNDLCINCNLLREDQLNSSFSRLPLCGRFSKIWSGK